MDQRQNQPAAVGPQTQKYVVQSGDTLIKIAEKVYGNPRAFTDIFNANQDVILDPDHLVAGTELYIPPSAEQIHRQFHAHEPADTAAGQANQPEKGRQRDSSSGQS